MQLAFAALKAATKEFHGDADWTYLAGLSMGWFGTREIASRYPHKFAAIAPTCVGIYWPDCKDIPDLSRPNTPQDLRCHPWDMPRGLFVSC
jgi:hypothetical protein